MKKKRASNKKIAKSVAKKVKHAATKKKVSAKEPPIARHAPKGRSRGLPADFLRMSAYIEEMLGHPPTVFACDVASLPNAGESLANLFRASDNHEGWDALISASDNIAVERGVRGLKLLKRVDFSGCGPFEDVRDEATDDDMTKGEFVSKFFKSRLVDVAEGSAPSLDVTEPTWIIVLDHDSQAVLALDWPANG